MVYGRRHRRNSRWPLLGFGLGGGAIAAVVIATAVGLTQVAGSQACAAVFTSAGASVSGTATHYVLQPGGGNCMFPFPPGDGLFVALSPSEYDGAAPCGSYLEVSGPDGSVRVEVADQCPPCASGHIDLSEAAFSKIAPLAAGLVSVRYQTITDPPLPAPVALRVKEGSSQYWLALLVMNAGNPVASVQVETGSGWLDLAHASYNYWIAQSGAGPGPFTVRVTDTLGHQLTLRDVALEPGVLQDTGTRMYGAGAAPLRASATPSVSTSAPASPSKARAAGSAATTRRARQAAAPATGLPTAPAPVPRAVPTC